MGPGLGRWGQRCGLRLSRLPGPGPLRSCGSTSQPAASSPGLGGDGQPERRCGAGRFERYDAAARRPSWSRGCRRAACCGRPGGRWPGHRRICSVASSRIRAYGSIALPTRRWVRLAVTRRGPLVRKHLVVITQALLKFPLRLAQRSCEVGQFRTAEHHQGDDQDDQEFRSTDATHGFGSKETARSPNATVPGRAQAGGENATCSEAPFLVDACDRPMYARRVAAQARVIQAASYDEVSGVLEEEKDQKHHDARYDDGHMPSPWMIDREEPPDREHVAAERHDADDYADDGSDAGCEPSGRHREREDDIGQDAPRCRDGHRPLKAAIGRLRRCAGGWVSDAEGPSGDLVGTGPPERDAPRQR